ncbi:hypothetical protein BC830DRAFT_104698 [Chytriomyces sp. MP71]|nr:hypothetical protein BC830DRAFT_104698 [Chytriomyces sp. MP71]
MIETSVRVLLQRIPGTLILLLFPLLMLGPYYAPVFFSVYFIFLTFAVFFLSVRSALGIFATWVKFIVEKDVDWMKLRTEEMHRRKLTGEAEMAVTDIVHVVVVPNYKESMETLVETLDVLGSHDLASTNYVVCLAMEETEDGCVEKAEALTRMYGEAFRLLTYTVHPKNIAGEIRGKSSNTNWACTELHKRLTTHGSLSLIPRIVVPATTGAVSRASTATLSEDPGPERHIFTCMDADTCFAADYFACVAYRYVSMNVHARKAAMFIPSLVFDRNSQSVNPVVRMIDVGWSASQMAYFIPYYPFKYATSAYSVPMELAEAVNFWDTSREAIGEDVHMTFKCMFATGGRLRVIPIASPASQFNVVGKKENFISGCYARIEQMKRHMWGSLDFGYTLRMGLRWSIGQGLDRCSTYWPLFITPANSTSGQLMPFW